MLYEVDLLMIVVHVAAAAMNSTFVRYQMAEYKDTRISAFVNKFWKSSLPMCAARCEKTDTCVAFSFHVKGTCELSRQTPNKENTLPGVGWSIYIKHQDKCSSELSSYDGFTWDKTSYWDQYHVASFDGNSSDLEMEIRCTGGDGLNVTSIWSYGLYKINEEGTLKCNTIYYYPESVNKCFVAKGQVFVTECSQSNQMYACVLY